MDIKEYLNQGETWTTPAGGGPALKIADMTVEARRRACRWLLDHSVVLITLTEVSINEELAVGDHTDLRAVLSLVNTNPRHWVKNTALFKALGAGLPTREVLDV